MKPGVRAERGFSVLELLVAIGLLAVVGFATLGALQFFARALDARVSGSAGTVSLEQLLGRMRAEAATSYAVFVPDRDVFGRPNAPAPPAPAPSGAAAPHEVDFYTRTDAGVEAWWAYDFDAARGTLQRYDFDPRSHVAGIADRTTGRIDPRATYAPVTGVRGFEARRLEANELASPASAYGPAVAGLLPAASRTPAPDPVGFVPQSGAPRDDLYGGNASVELRVTTERGARTLHLATAALPSGFTVHAAPAIRAFVYRIDVVHRFWFGLAQITHAQIFEQLQYSFDATSAHPAWKVWCDYELYGHGIAGLRLGDPRAAYDPHSFAESTAGIYYTATHDGFVGLDPTHCNDRVPTPQTSYAPLPAPTSPDIVDTPPPCFYLGRCWPERAPPDWAPPSPWPAAAHRPRGAPIISRRPCAADRERRPAPLRAATGLAPHHVGGERARTRTSARRDASDRRRLDPHGNAGSGEGGFPCDDGSNDANRHRRRDHRVRALGARSRYDVRRLERYGVAAAKRARADSERLPGCDAGRRRRNARAVRARRARDVADSRSDERGGRDPREPAARHCRRAEPRPDDQRAARRRYHRGPDHRSHRPHDVRRPHA